MGRRKEKGKVDEHLKPYLWKKGCPSPNPAGRPRNKTPTEIMREFLGAEHDADQIKAVQATMPEPWRSSKRITVEMAVWWVMILASLNTRRGDNSRKELLDRLEGKVPLRLAGAMGGAIDITSGPKFDYKKLSEDDAQHLRELLIKATVDNQE